MKTVVGASAGLRRDQLSVGTCVLESDRATTVGSSGTIWAYTPAYEGERIPIKVREEGKIADAAGVYQFQSSLPETNVCYFALTKIAPGLEPKPTIVSVREKAGMAQLQFPYPRMLYSVWTVLAPRTLEPLESVESTSQSFMTGGAATASESLAGPERAHPQWIELALSSFPRMRGMTETESAAYKALKLRIFQRR